MPIDIGSEHLFDFVTIFFLVSLTEDFTLLIGVFISNSTEEGF